MKRLILLILFILTPKISKTSITIINSEKYLLEISQYMRKIFEQNFVNDFNYVTVMYVNLNKTFYEDVSYLLPTLPSLQMSKVIRREFQISNIRYKASIGVFLLEEPKYLESNLLLAVKLYSWTPSAFWFFIITSPELNDITWLKEFADILWHYDLLNAVVIFYLNNTVQAFTFDPFLNENHIINITGSTNRTTLFPKKLNQLYGYKIPVSLFSFPPLVIEKHNPNTGISEWFGTDPSLWNAIATTINASLYVVGPDKGTMLEGALEDVRTRKSEVAINSQIVFQTDDVDFSYPHGKMDICVVVPKGKIKPYYLSLFSVFDWITWVLIILSIPFGGAFFLGLQHATHPLIPEKDKPRFGKAVMKVLGLFYGKYFFNYKPWSQRMFMLCVLWYGVIVTVAFSTKLMNMLISEKYLDDITTVDELDHSELPVFGRKYYLNILRQLTENTTGSLSRIVSRYVTLPLDKLNWEMINDHTYNRAYIVQYETARYVVEHQQNQIDGRPMLAIMNEVLIPALAGYAFAAGSPIARDASQLMQRLKSAGLFIMFQKSTVNLDFVEVVKYSSDDDNAQIKLTLKQVQNVFLLYFVGLALATIALILELLVSRYQLLFIRKKQTRHVLGSNMNFIIPNSTKKRSPFAFHGFRN